MREALYEVLPVEAMRGYAAFQDGCGSPAKVLLSISLCQVALTIDSSKLCLPS
jgi:hypothetical protein